MKLYNKYYHTCIEINIQCDGHTLQRLNCVWVPGRKGTRARAVCCWKYAVFTPNFTRITARYRPKPFTSGAIENKVKRGALRLCARSNLRLLSFNDPEYRPLQACLNVETLSSLIFEPLAPARLGVTGRWTVNISRISADIRVVPTNARANHVFARSFSPGYTLYHLLCI